MLERWLHGHLRWRFIGTTRFQIGEMSIDSAAHRTDQSESFDKKK